MIKNIKFVLFFLCVLVGFAAVQVSAQTVTMTMPAQNALDVGENTDIYVFFDKSIDPSTVSSSTIKVVGSENGRYNTQFLGIYGTYIKIGCKKYFSFGEKITVTLTDGIHFTDGTSLADGYSFLFSVNSCGIGNYDAVSEDEATSDNIYRMVKADFNGDGMIDFVTSDGSDFISVLLNSNGSLSLHQRQFFNGFGFHEMCAADFNGDGYVDLVAQGSTWGKIVVLKNDGLGNFSTSVESSSYPMRGSYPADMDNDGDMDLVIVKVVADIYGDETYSLVILYNNGNGSFVNPLEVDSYVFIFESASHPKVADFNNDGLLDIAVSLISYGSSKVIIYLNNGLGGFTESPNYQVNGNDKLIVEDFDSDGLLDIATFYQTTYYSTIQILENNNNGTFSLQPAITLPQYTTSFTSGDFDGDSDIDLATVSSATANNNGIQILDNDNGSFTTGLYIPDYFSGSQFLSADVDGNRCIDFIATKGQYDHNVISVKKGKGAPDAPILLSPSNGAFFNAPAAPTLDCSDVVAAIFYYFEIDDDPNFGSPITSPLLNMASEWTVSEYLNHGTYYWRVMSRGNCGDSEWSTTRNLIVLPEIQGKVALDNIDGNITNFPNPFNPTTTISYNIPVNTHVKLEVINLLGQTIKTLVDQSQVAGEHSVMWDGKNGQGAEVSSGVYFYRIQSDDFNTTKKMMLLK